MTGCSFLDGRVTLHHGDCLDVLRAMPANSVDSVASDPPYHLTSIVKRYSSATAKPTRARQTGAYARASRGFMGKSWDGGDIAFRPELWREVFRVLKPGGHVVAFSAARTYHRMATAIEAAGFEIRDAILDVVAQDAPVDRFMQSLSEDQADAFLQCLEDSRFGGVLAWIYGSGFPKSHNVSKAIQRRRIEDEEPTRAVCRRVRSAMDLLGLKSRDLTRHLGNCNARLIDHWAARDTDSQPAVPTVAQWSVLRGILGIASAELDAEVERLNARKGAYGDAWTGAEIVGEHGGMTMGFAGERFTVRDPSLRALTAEAAALDGWGTALKPAFEPICLARKPMIGSVAENVLAHGVGPLNINGCRVEDGGDLGRWPANVVHDGSPSVLAAFPQATGAQRGTGPQYEPKVGTAVYGDFGRRPATQPRDKGGSAARFFYSAKADADDRIGSKHATVKPVDLMRWLVRMITPPDGLVLDMFAGSGTTGEAAFREGMRAVLIEREADHCEDIGRRMNYVLAGPDERKRVIGSLKAGGQGDGLDLFTLVGDA